MFQLKLLFLIIELSMIPLKLLFFKFFLPKLFFQRVSHSHIILLLFSCPKEANVGFNQTFSKNCFGVILSLPKRAIQALFKHSTNS